jgi:hypothetical protein
MSDKNDQPNAVRIDAFGFDIDRPRRGVSMFGIFLIAFGLLLVASSLFDAAQLGANALFLALGLVLLLIWLRDRGEAALILGVIVTALAASNLLTGIGALKGQGWGTTFLGTGALLVAFVRARSGRSWAWAVIIGGLLLLWGGSEAAASYTNVDLNRLVGPLLLILLGLWLVSRRRDFGR